MENEAIINADEPLIYVGPNSFALMLKKFQVFSGGLPQYVKRAIEQIPKIERLIVHVSELEEMRAKIERSAKMTENNIGFLIICADFLRTGTSPSARRKPCRGGASLS